MSEIDTPGTIQRVSKNDPNMDNETCHDRQDMAVVATRAASTEVGKKFALQHGAIMNHSISKFF